MNTRLEELILYVASRCQGDERFGKTKLNKILFYADFGFYQATGRSITEQQYQKQAFGPVAVDSETTMATLQERGDLAIGRRQYFNHVQLVPFALRDPLLEAFTGAEIAFVADVIARVAPMNAREVSDLSHEFIGWQAARLGEIIPYQTALVDVAPPSAADWQHLEALVADQRHLAPCRPLVRRS